MEVPTAALAAINRISKILDELEKNVGSIILTPPVGGKIEELKREVASLKDALGIVDPQRSGQTPSEVSPQAPLPLMM